MPELHEWENFYVIVGGAAGALIGLQFVVMTLVAERPPLRAAEAGAAFATPTIVHFSAALLVSALVSVPWQTITLAAAAWGVVGAAGMAYAAIVAWRMRNQTTYKPDLDDWTFFAALPFAGYLFLVASSLMTLSDTRDGLFGVGASALLLLFLGIHNAWDSVAYLVYFNMRQEQTEGQRDKLSDREKR